MLVRLILLALVLAAGWYGVQRALGPRRLRLPLIWRSVAGRHPDVARALALRTAIARLLLDAPDGRFVSVMGEVDGLVGTLVQLARAREEKGLPMDPDVGRTLDDLDALRGQIEAETAAEGAAAVDDLRARLAVRSEALRETLAARRELGE
ncbi:MAG: hypothetical protein H6701_14565 [Myxococcales bacterium]|nr:hypothetical protein [Myxococcales bacterium]